MRTISKALISLLGVLALSTVAIAKPLYDSVKSYVFVLNQKNFDAQVLKNRQKGITIVNFYKESGKWYLLLSEKRNLENSNTN